MARLSLHRRAQPQFRLPYPQLRLKQQQLRLATVTGIGRKNLMSDYRGTWWINRYPGVVSGRGHMQISQAAKNPSNKLQACDMYSPVFPAITPERRYGGIRNMYQCKISLAEARMICSSSPRLTCAHYRYTQQASPGQITLGPVSTPLTSPYYLAHPPTPKTPASSSRRFQTPYPAPSAT